MFYKSVSCRKESFGLLNQFAANFPSKIQDIIPDKIHPGSLLVLHNNGITRVTLNGVKEDVLNDPTLR